jgi:ABC-type uncharacterized transport system involved in gliding motility auxiliary subunit
MTLSRRTYAVLALALAAAIFAGVNVALDAAVTGAQIDLTENGRFTVSPGTRAIIRGLKEPVRLRFFFSRKIAAGYPATRSYAGRVRDLLARYAALSDGKIVLEEIDPEPFTTAEDEASAAGLTPAPTDSGEQVYFGLSGSNRIDGRETIPYFSPDREAYLEYDLSSLIWRLANPQKPKLAILTTLPLAGGMSGTRPFAVYRELSRNYDTVMLPPDFAVVPAGVSMLMIVQPSPLTDAQTYAIDQFALKGGRIAVFVDPDSELSSAGGAYGQPAAASDLPRLFRAWGIGFDARKEILDLDLAQKVQTAADPQSPVALYPAWLHVTQEGFDATDPITADMQTLNLASAGALYPLKGASTHFAPLVRSSARAAEEDTAAVRTNLRPQDLIATIVPSGTRYAIAARITGPAKTAFPKGIPGAKSAPVESARSINVVVMADTDVFDDRFWVRTASLGGKPMDAAFADNGAFVLNTVENLMGSDDLISLRTRANGERPFTLVRMLQAEAEAQYREEAESLKAKLSETQSRLRELQAGDGGKADDLATAAKQKAETERFKHEISATRASLRKVQHNLRKDIDALGDFLAFVDIALIPLLVTAFALIAARLRRRRRARAATV